ncbi:Hypothetical protein A7982_01792 [Minicystis rosea]|nr:Hypothetical protein A7982_01792 [Minicystis rosea]
MKDRPNPPQKLSEVKTWLAAHVGHPGLYAALSWAPKRKNAVHDACIRGLVTLASPRALDALATYREQDAGDLAELGDAWDRFDRAEFARRVLSSPLVIGSKHGLARIDGIEHVADLDTLTLAVAKGCSLAPLARCPDILSLDLACHGDVDLAPLAALPQLDLCELRGSETVTHLAALAGARMRKLSVSIGPEASWRFLADLPRLERVRVVCKKPVLSKADGDVLQEIFARGIALCGYAHEPWTSGLESLANGRPFIEQAGFRAVGAGNRPLSSFLSG